VNTADKSKLEQKIKAEIRKLSAYTAEHESGQFTQTPETDSTVKIEELAIQAVDQHTLAEARKKIATLNRTLTKIDDDNFGVCADCGIAISLERLLIVPDTNKCPECAT
jgi:DnaK suppressor protein